MLLQVCENLRGTKTFLKYFIFGKISQNFLHKFHFRWGRGHFKPPPPPPNSCMNVEVNIAHQSILMNCSLNISVTHISCVLTLPYFMWHAMFEIQCQFNVLHSTLHIVYCRLIRPST